MAIQLLPFCDVPLDRESDFFVVLSKKELGETAKGNPYFKVTFQDAQRAVNSMIWNDSVWFSPCSDVWRIGNFYKIRGVVKGTKYGDQLEINQIRDVREEDRQNGFSETDFVAQSAFDVQEMYDDILDILIENIGENDPLFELCKTIFTQYKEELLAQSAASHNHHAFVGGWLEHTRNVTKNAVFLAHRYAEQYPDLDPPIDIGLVAAGAALHDIGKLREIALVGVGFEYTVEGNLIGHMLQGRDIVRETCCELKMEGERVLLLEHIIIAHQRLPEWGAPKPPMIPEALLVHYADDIDAKFAIMTGIRNAIPSGELFSTMRNSLTYKIYRADGEDY